MAATFASTPRRPQVEVACTCDRASGNRLRRIRTAFDVMARTGTLWRGRIGDRQSDNHTPNNKQPKVAAKFDYNDPIHV